MARKVWKKYKAALALVNRENRYELAEAVELVKKVSYTKFNWTVEIHISTAADPRYNDQMMRGTVVLPHWIGKVVKIAAFVSEDKVEEAKKLWADIAWNELLLKDLEAWKVDFDVLITTPDMMRDLAKAAKILWPKGLMPSPKAWTVTNNLTQTIDELKKWRIEYKLDKTGNFHIPVWKIQFDAIKLQENIQVLLKTLEENRPSWVKWKLIRKIVLAPTMGPWVPVQS